jgi:calcineurin-like phosphoesterase family protein
VEEMNEHMIEQWNSVVKPQDRVIHLGDVFFGPKEEFVPIWNRLNGTKELIVGNHDDIKFFAKNDLVSKIHMWKPLLHFGIMLSHIPLERSSLRWNIFGKPDLSDDQYLLNVHGHIHQKASPPGPYYNASVENIAYTPIHIEELAEKVKQLT